jgi:hypothetical protein
MPIIFNPFTGNLEFKSSSGGGGGTSFIQGGNSFGALAVLGTNDSNSLNIRTAGITALSFDTSQSATFFSNIKLNDSGTPRTTLEVQGSNTLRLGNGFSGGTLNIIPFLTSLSGSLLVTFDIFMGALVAIKDPAGAIYLQFQQVVSAVNSFRINNAITGAGPILSAQGSDTNIDSNYQTKGTGSHNFSGRVNLGSGSTINAPLKLTSGTLTTGGNILPGNFEFLTDDFYLTGSTGNTRKIIRDLVRTDVSANITIDGNHEFVNATANTFTITLPTAVGYNKQFTIANSGTGIITINTTGGQTISNNVSGSITMIQFDTLVLRSNGVNWIKIN